MACTIFFNKICGPFFTYRIELSWQGLDNVYTSLYKLTSNYIHIMYKRVHKYDQIIRFRQRWQLMFKNHLINPAMNPIDGWIANAGMMQRELQFEHTYPTCQQILESWIRFNKVWLCLLINQVYGALKTGDLKMISLTLPIGHGVGFWNIKKLRSLMTFDNVG